jgi:hypothetical protein
MRETVALSVLSRSLFLVGAPIILAPAGTIRLWAHDGAAVCFETIRPGCVACFG